MFNAKEMNKISCESKEVYRRVIINRANMGHFDARLSFQNIEHAKNAQEDLTNNGFHVDYSIKETRSVWPAIYEFKVDWIEGNVSK